MDLDKSKTFCVYFHWNFLKTLVLERTHWTGNKNIFAENYFDTVVEWTHSFVVLDSADNLLGDGGFGNVYQMNYMGQDAAVKIFSAIGDIHPHKMLRQEVLWQGSY